MRQQSPVVIGLLSRAFALHQNGRYAEAEQLYKAVLQIDPRQADAHHLLGVLASDCGDDESAVRWIRQALAVSPRFAAAHVNLGLALRRMTRYDEALESYAQAILIEPGLIEAHFNRGNVLRDTGHSDKAFESFLRILEIQPLHAEALNSCGSILWTAERYEESLEYLDRALGIDPNFVGALINKASALEKLGRIDEALDIYNRTLTIAPDHVIALINRGAIFDEQGLTCEALEHFLRAQVISPDCANAHWNEALCRLKMGEYKLGWEKYEWRWKELRKSWIRGFDAPQWAGEYLNGKTILLHAEQGLGDSLQFCRYATLVAQRGGRVILEVQPALVSLMTSLNGVERVVARGTELPEFDIHCPLLSLPGLFDTRLDTVPYANGYLSAPSDALDRWRAKLMSCGGKKIGVVWGTTTKDRSKAAEVDRFAPLFQTDMNFFVVQKELGASDRLYLDRYKNVHLFDGDLSDFVESAALVSLLDVVVTIDTSVAHLAGALGKKVLIMLPFSADWRWLLERTDSPWYASARLLRQAIAGDWQGVVEEVLSELETE